MKKYKKPIAYVTVIVLIYGVYVLFGGRIANAFNNRAAGQAQKAGDYERAAMLYEKVLEASPRDEKLRFQICDLYREAGNYSRAEYILSAGLRDIGLSTALYAKLCAVYAEQDKFYDAVELLGGIRYPVVSGEIESARPAPPVFTPSGGDYEERIAVELSAGADCLIYISWTGGVPSMSDGYYAGAVALEPGVTHAVAVAVNRDGLVSDWSEARFILQNIVDPVAFADPVLEAVIRNAINRPDGALFTPDLWDITELIAPDPAGYATLDDLQYCPRLETLMLIGEGASCDVSALSFLQNLTTLHLTSFGITSRDLEFIGQCAALRQLVLKNNNIGSVQPLERLEQLEELNLMSNSILDVSPLGRLGSLRALRLTQNAVQDLNGLSSLSNLQNLYADQNSIASLQGVEKLKSLRVLDVSYNLALTGIAEISGLANLVKLTAEHCQIEKIPSLSGIKALEILHIGGNQIDTLDGLRGQTALKELLCPSNLIASLEPLEGCAALEILDASHNSISSLEPLRGLPALREAAVEYNVLKTLLPLKDCPSLKRIEAFGNALTDPLNAWDGTGVEIHR